MTPPGFFESLSSLKSVSTQTAYNLRADTAASPHVHDAHVSVNYGIWGPAELGCDSHDGLSLVNAWFNTCHFISAWRGTSPRKRRIRVFVNSYNRTWQSGDWPLAELFYGFQTAPVSRAQLPDPPLRMRVFEPDCQDCRDALPPWAQTPPGIRNEHDSKVNLLHSLNISFSRHHH